MAKKRTTYNRTNKNTETPSARKARKEARANGRGENSAFTSGSRSVDFSQDNAKAMQRLWENNTSNAVYTRSLNGKLSADGRKAGGNTWTYTNRDMDGNLVSQSGRKSLSTRRQRDYDTRVGMNNISPKVIERWLSTGIAREVNGNLVGGDGTVIRRKADGNYTMGLSAG